MITRDALAEMSDEAFAGIDLALSKRREELDRAIFEGTKREAIADLLAIQEAAERWWLTIGYRQSQLDEDTEGTSADPLSEHYRKPLPGGPRVGIPATRMPR